MAHARNYSNVLAKPERAVWGDVNPYPSGGLIRVAVAKFDPSANASERTQAAHTLNVTLPIGALVLRANYDVITTFTSGGGDAATIALHIQAANDVVTAIAINNGGNPWDAGIHAVTLTAGSFKVATTDKVITATVAGGNDLTAGKMYIYIEYVMAGV